MRLHSRSLLCLFFLSAGLFWAAGAANDDDAPTTPRPHKKGSQTTRSHASPTPRKKVSDDDDDASAKPAPASTPKPHGSPSSAHKKAGSDDDDSAAKNNLTPFATPKPHASPSRAGGKKADDDDAKPSDKATPRPHASPGGHKKESSDQDDDAAPLHAPGHHKKTSADDDDGSAKPDATANGKEPPPNPAASGAETAAANASKYAPSASIPSSELAGFSEQPPKVRQMIESALELAKLNLTYTFGSADPASGGMDCSGTIYYLLRQQGFADVPRDASGQYTWVRKHHLFYAVISKKAGGFEFADLLPGDLLFWNGTYNADRDPPVTHTMLYLGIERRRKVPVMWGSSDGRSYDGKQRYGVSVFDFRMPRQNDPQKAGAPQAEFLGYARIPGLREVAE